jgi:hypothetical protein
MDELVVAIYKTFLVSEESVVSERFDKNWDDLGVKLGYRNAVEMLEDFYVNQELSLHQIGDRLGCSSHAVGRNLARRGIQRRGKGGSNNTSNQTRKLFMLDQRVVLFYNFNECARVCGVSTTLLHKYRKLMKGDH